MLAFLWQTVAASLLVIVVAHALVRGLISTFTVSKVCSAPHTPLMYEPRRKEDQRMMPKTVEKLEDQPQQHAQEAEADDGKRKLMAMDWMKTA